MYEHSHAAHLFLQNTHLTYYTYIFVHIYVHAVHTFIHIHFNIYMFTYSHMCKHSVCAYTLQIFIKIYTTHVLCHILILSHKHATMHIYMHI